jgi:hypothetical protein
MTELKPQSHVLNYRENRGVQEKLHMLVWTETLTDPLIRQFQPFLKNDAHVAGTLLLNSKDVPTIGKGSKPKHTNHAALHRESMAMMKCTDKTAVP